MQKRGSENSTIGFEVRSLAAQLMVAPAGFQFQGSSSSSRQLARHSKATHSLAGDDICVARSPRPEHCSRIVSKVDVENDQSGTRVVVGYQDVIFLVRLDHG